MSGATHATADSVHVLITLRAVLCKVDSSPKHSTNVRMSFVESLLNNGVDERTSVEQHSFAFAGLLSALLRNLLATMCVAVPQLPVLHFLDANDVVSCEVSS